MGVSHISPFPWHLRCIILFLFSIHEICFCFLVMTKVTKHKKKLKVTFQFLQPKTQVPKLKLIMSLHYVWEPSPDEKQLLYVLFSLFLCCFKLNYINTWHSVCLQQELIFTYFPFFIVTLEALVFHLFKLNFPIHWKKTQ